MRGLGVTKWVQKSQSIIFKGPHDIFEKSKLLVSPPGIYLIHFSSWSYNIFQWIVAFFGFSAKNLVRPKVGSFFSAKSKPLN